MGASNRSVKHPSGTTEPARREYSSPVRDEQARATRRAIVVAATELFLANGYASTTMEAIAAAAGVSRKTVFIAGGSKFILLKDAYDWSLVGDDEPVAMADRAPVQRILATTDQREIVRLWAALMVDTHGRAAPIGAVVAAAAAVDDQAADMVATSHRQRHDGARAFVAHLAAHGGLRPGLTHDDATDRIWLANDPVNYQRLVVERGWSPQRFRGPARRRWSAGSCWAADGFDRAGQSPSGAVQPPARLSAWSPS